jgi:signal transduction histidine kinase
VQIIHNVLSQNDKKQVNFWIYCLQLAILAIIYFITAKWGLSLSPVSGFATFVWPPTGIGLAALLLLGRKLWPGIFIGAYFINYITGAAPIMALGIAFGNTIELITAAYLLNHLDFHKNLGRLKDVLLIVVLASFSSTLIAASIGTFTLLIGGKIVISAFPFTWFTWWIGDMLGILIITPLILVWSGRIEIRAKAQSLWEAVILVSVFLIVTLFIFGSSKSDTPILAGAPYLLFSFLIWVAVRFNVRFVSTLIFLLSAITVWSANNRHGPFSSPNLHVSLLSSQLFLSAVAITFLAFSGVMSERRSALVTIQALNEALENSLSKIKAKLRKEQELDKLRDEFVATASHELKTPITSIKARAQALETILSARKDHEAHQIAVGIDKQSDVLTKLSDDLLDISKASNGKFIMHKSNFSVDDLIEKILNDYKQSFATHRIIKRGSSNQYIDADRNRIEQVIVNLLSNAVKYSPSNTRIIISVQASKTAIMVRVKDHGSGISSRDQKKIFNRFYRTKDDRTNKQAVSGLGLGLYIASEIIKQHKGKIWVNSKLGYGSTFSFSLPID